MPPGKKKSTKKPAKLKKLGLQCLFCLKKVGEDRRSRECSESLFDSCFRHLSSDIVKKPTLEEFANNNGPFCNFCYFAAQHLDRINDLLRSVEKEVNNFVTSLTFSILGNRNAAVTSPFDYHSNVDIQIHQKVEILDAITIETDENDIPIDEDYVCEIEIHDEDGMIIESENNTERVVIAAVEPVVKKDDTKSILKKINLERKPIRQTPEGLSCKCGKAFESEGKLIEHSICCPDNDLYLNEAEKSDATIRYRCGNCGFLTQSLESLDEHKKRHYKKYPCKTCGEKFGLKKLLRLHMHVHREARHKCSKCGRSFLSRRLLLEHFDRHDKGSDVDMDEGIPTNPTDLWKNPKNPKRPPERKCPICGKICASQVYLNYHKLSKHSTEKPYECSVCNRKFKMRRFLTTHMQTHVTVRDYLCAEDKCGKSFYSLLKLRQHTKLEHTDEHFKCELCGFKTLFPKAIENHKLHYHDPNKKFVCDVCGVRVSALATLHNHQRIHTGEKPHECKTCGEFFRTTTLLKIHTNQSHTTGNFKCPDCDYVAGTHYLLKSHSIVHSEDRPYSCDKCGKSFKAKASVLKHQRTSCKIAT